MSECKFCEALRSWQQAKSMDSGSKQECTVALVIRSWRPPYRPKYRATRVTDFRHGGLGYKLNFCPECGRDLQKNRIPKDANQPAVEYVSTGMDLSATVPLSSTKVVSSVRVIDQEIERRLYGQRET